MQLMAVDSSVQAPSEMRSENLRVLCFDLSPLSSEQQLVALTLGALSTAIGFAFLQVRAVAAAIRD
jgi:hypothetical protein